MTPKTLKCAHCGKAAITCRKCGRKMCRHYAASVIDPALTPEERKAQPITGLPKLTPGSHWEGTCTPCRMTRGR